MLLRIVCFAVAVVCFACAVLQLETQTKVNLSQETAADSPVQRTEMLRAPNFNDVSAFSDADIALVDKWLQSQVDLAHYPSLCVSIVRDNKTVYQRAFGFQDVAAAEKATLENSYHVASVTKVFTTSLAVILHQRGVIDLNRPVLSYLPKPVSISRTPKVGAKITLRQLASHTSGLPRGVPGPVQSVEGRYELEPQRLYALLAKSQLVFDPGTAELYSNLGMGLLGHALECAAGKPFEHLVKELLCDPLHLERTAFRDSEDLHLATHYSSAIPREPKEHSYRSRLAPSGGLIASVQDLTLFLSAQMKAGVFTKEMLGELHTPTKLLNGSDARTGLGWAVRSRDSIGRIIKKNGGRDNCKAWIGFSPEYNVGVAVVTNCGEPNVDRIGYWLLERSVSGVDPKLLDRRAEVQHQYAKVAPFTGVRWVNDKPIVQVNGNWSPVVSVDGIQIERIMKFAKLRFGVLARKRFTEDFVEVMSTMGHEPDWTVTLGLMTKSGQTKRLKIRMTKENRKLASN